MIISLIGTNSYLLKNRLDQLTGDFINQYGDLAVERLDGAEAEPSQVLDAAQALPFLAERKLVILRQPLLNKQLADQLEQIISSIADTTDLIVVEPSPDKRTAAFKMLKALTKLEEFSELKEPELVSWLINEADHLSYKLSRGDANYLVERVGANQAVLASELNKLGLYDKRITRQSIDQLTDKSPQSKIFDLLDAAFGGNKSKALALYEEQRAQKVEPQAILALITWQLNLLVLAKLGKGKTASAIAKDAKLNPYPVQKAQALSAKITYKKLAEMVGEATQIDYKSKQSRLDIDEALKTFITTT